MRLPTALLTGASLMMATLMPGQVAAEAKLYPYHASANYCPAGLQPITMAGVICCGTPNQHQSYQQVMAHPVAKKRHRVAKRTRYIQVGKSYCEAGTKGCN